jgi:hypothetical protein
MVVESLFVVLVGKVEGGEGEGEGGENKVFFVVVVDELIFFPCIDQVQVFFFFFYSS